MFWKKWVPWEGSTAMPASLHSTMARAPAIWCQATGMPSQGSEVPQRPGPMSR